MPELPEVETVCNGLRDNIIGKKIVDTVISQKKLRTEYPVNFVKDLQFSIVNSVTRRARYILLDLTSNKTLLIHLGMSGKVNYYTSQIDAKKHDHCIVNFEDKSCLIYNDPRRFGVIDLIDNAKLSEHKMIKNLGPEPLLESFNASYLYQKLQNKQMNIKTAMMDNSLVVGVGNIYINESLFQSGISPLRSSKSLKLEEIELLVGNIKSILKLAIESGGSTLRDYVDSNGDIGRFQFDFKVYGRHNQNCTKCGNQIERIKQNGRSSFFCRVCQI